MSNGSSFRREDREKQYAEGMQELESVKALNRSLTVYLEHLRLFSKNLTETNKNLNELGKVNKQWNTLLNFTKGLSQR